MESTTKVVKSIAEIEKISSDISLMDITFEDGYKAKYISTYASAQKCLNKEVLVSFRDDIYKGIVEKFIAEISILTITSTLERDKDIKLYSEETGEIYSTIAFDDIPDTGVVGAILFCTNVQLERSDKGIWFKFTCLDRNRKSCSVRLFDPIREKANFIGRYVSMDIRKGKIDYIARKVAVTMGSAPEPNPEIRIAKAFILDVLREYPVVLEFVDRTKILSSIESYNLREDIEPGYEMVRLAIEIEQVRNLRNITKELDTEAMIKHCILARGYCVTDNESTVKSKELQNLYFAIQNNLINSKLDMHLLDYKTEINSAELSVLKQIHGLALSIAIINRTYFYDKVN